MRYTIRKITAEHKPGVLPDDQIWNLADELRIDHFHERSSDSRPEVVCRALYDNEGIYLRYSLKDRWVKCVAKKYQDSVCLDSCVEFFIEPAGGKGYCNFEFNAVGVMLVSHVVDCARTDHGFADFHNLPEKYDKLVLRKSTLRPEDVETEITDPCDWELRVFIPFSLFREEFGRNVPVSGETWRGNFYTCADKTSHPRWATWNPVKILNFHQPECFGEIEFE